MTMDRKKEEVIVKVTMDVKRFLCVVLKVHTFNGPVAQLVRAPPCHGGGQGFEPPSGRC